MRLGIRVRKRESQGACRGEGCFLARGRGRGEGYRHFSVAQIGKKKLEPQKWVAKVPALAGGFPAGFADE